MFVTVFDLDDIVSKCLIADTGVCPNAPITPTATDIDDTTIGSARSMAPYIRLYIRNPKKVHKANQDLALHWVITRTLHYIG